MKQTGIITVCIASLLLFACSGGTGGSGAGGTGGGTSDVSSGEVTKTGSVYVNGVRFDTTGASYTHDGVATSVSDASLLNMRVEVKGSINGASSTAASVAISSTVKGEVDSVLNDTTMTVMGQTVRLADGAVVSTISNADVLTDLVQGNFVEVHGEPQPNGVVVASYVEEKLLGEFTEFKVTGYITTGSITATTFDIGALTIDFSTADMTDMPAGQPQNDLLVEVKSAAAAPAPNMLATKVEPEGLSVSSAPEVEVEGYVKDLTGSNPYNFFINGQEVQTSATTEFVGVTETYLAENVKVEAEGTLVGGVLNAYKVYLKDSIRVEGDIENYSSGTFNIKGMAGVSFSINAATENNSAVSLASNLHVRLRGYPETGSSVIVTRIRDRNPNTRVYLRGPAESAPTGLGGTEITVMGITVDVNGLSFQNLDDSSMSQANFLAAIQTGTPVKLNGDFNGVSIVWDSAELED